MIEQKRKARKKQTGEDFTPPDLVNEILEHFPKDIFEDSTKTWLDPAAGNGNFLVEVLARLLKHHSKEHILNNQIFGVDLMDDNCEEMITRLYGDGIVQQVPYKDLPANYKTEGVKCGFTYNGEFVPNIICADGLKYNYTFGRCEPSPSETLFDWD